MFKFIKDLFLSLVNSVKGLFVNPPEETVAVEKEAPPHFDYENLEPLSVRAPRKCNPLLVFSPEDLWDMFLEELDGLTHSEAMSKARKRVKEISDVNLKFALYIHKCLMQITLAVRVGPNEPHAFVSSKKIKFLNKE